MSKVKVHLPDKDWYPSPARKAKAMKETVSSSAKAQATSTITKPKDVEDMELGSSQESTISETPTSTPGSTTESGLTSTQESAQESLDLEDEYPGLDPLKELNDDLISSQGETLMDTTESADVSSKLTSGSVESNNPLTEAIVEGAEALGKRQSEAEMLQAEYQGTVGREFKQHEYHPTPTLSPLTTADEEVAERYFWNPTAPVASSDNSELLLAVSTAHGVTAVMYDTDATSGNGQRVEQKKSGVATFATHP